MAPSTFHPFSRLPTELRFYIWEDALSVPAVWGISRITPSKSDDSVDTAASKFKMGFIGHAPYLVGLACRKAWQLIQRSSKIQIGRPSKRYEPSEPSAERQWVDLDNTVLYIDSSKHAYDIIEHLHFHTRCGVKHILFDLRESSLEPESKMVRITCLFGRTFPQLQTVIVRWFDMPSRKEGDKETSWEERREEHIRRILKPVPTPTLEEAEHYAALLTYTGPELDFPSRDTEGCRWELSYIFKAMSVPLRKVHFISKELTP
ncbi:uncharacterized protein C8A04DRAFT_29910 [Dichotomopilus funicola]|uniref:2EXR domain-containing protein n=1 Tax=Dichotomopilus funicola TaxID=1934379 RepID=A0AAN6ZMA4_9PEZI|nr:hypothetical protein C8A04DRAFT_29910 [Dichotomopilus funicola]